MRPIKLTFAGLNSYVEEQNIDFEKLTSRGFFGIFGPTGSGKSTILDAITIALYGGISRKSKEFLNTNCDELYVAYRFRLQSSEGAVEYTAERSFRRNKKGGKPNSKYVRLIKHNNTDELLAEKTNDMNERIIEILGLTMDDFTRSVVLPQGKFSEFLKLTGNDRRIMLERIFALEKYGRRMGEKIKKSFYENKNKQEYLKGQLKRYDNFSREGLEELKKKKATLEEQKLNFDQQLLEITKQYEEQHEIWKLQEELHQDEAQLDKLLQLKEKMNKINERIGRAEKVLMIRPYIDEYNQIMQAKREGTKLLDEIKENSSSIRKTKENFEGKLLNVEKYEKEDLPLWQEKLGQLKEAVKYTQDEKKLQILLKKKREQALELDKQNKELLITMNAYEKEQREVSEQISVITKEVNDTTLTLSYKVKVDQGADIEKQLKESNELCLQLEKEINNLATEKSNVDKSLSEIRTKDIDYRHEIKNIEEGIKALEKRKPHGLEALTLLQEEIIKLQQQKRNLETIYEQQEELRHNYLQLTKDGKYIQQQQLVQLEKEEKLITIKKDEQRAILEELQGKHMAALIAEKIKDGQACPVCGSTNHVKLATLSNDSNIEKLTEEQGKVEKELREIYNQQQLLQVKLIGINNELKRIQEQLDIQDRELKGMSLKAIKMEYEQKINNFQKLKKDNEQWEADWKHYQDKLKAINHSYNNNRQSLMRYEESYKYITEQLGQKNKSLSDQKKKALDFKVQIEKLAEELTINNFINEKERIQQVESHIQKLREQLTLLEEKSHSLSLKINENRESSNQIQINKIAFEKELELKDEELMQLRIKIHTISGEQDPVVAKKELEEKIIKYHEAAKVVRDKLVENTEQLKMLEIALAKEEQHMIELDKQEVKIANQKDKLMDMHGFINQQQVEDSYIEEIILDEQKKEIKTYEDNLAKAVGAVGRVKEKLAGRFVKRNDYEMTIMKKNQLQESKEKYLKESTAVDTQMIEYKKAITEAGDLLREKETIDHVLNMLEDLSKLIKGNRFIEYVAKNQFHYIVYEASKRLYDLTGRYGLELDENSEFLIRDDRNGGVLREAASLSGGETFLTSLALALALSSHIQLKGSYPLEFFFLDEGFGTLDTELLDVVMNSLEKLNHSQVNVGIISHVEELKNRVPIKLIIHPCELGGEGSKMHLEYS